MSAMASQIITLTIVYSPVCSRRGSKKTSKLRVTGLGAGNSPVTGEFPAQRASNAENVSIWWRHHATNYVYLPQQGWCKSGSDVQWAQCLPETGFLAHMGKTFRVFISHFIVQNNVAGNYVFHIMIIRSKSQIVKSISHFLYCFYHPDCIALLVFAL